MKFYKPERNPKYVKEVDELFEDMKTPVDFNKEIGEENDNSAQQAKTLGILSAVYGFFLLTLVLIPNPVSGRIAIASIALFMLGVGGVLLLAWKRMTCGPKVPVRDEETAVFAEPELE
jgi:hypothetical protein